MEIRAVAFNVPWDDLGRVPGFLEAAERLSPRPLTVRVTVTTPPTSEAAWRAVESLRDMGVEYVAVGVYRGGDLAEFVESTGAFAALTSIDGYLDFLDKADRRGAPELARNVALSLGGLVYDTPYYPAAVAKRRGISLSLLYPDDLRASPADVAPVLKAGEELGKSLAASFGEVFLGVDGSLSPWGERSVARAVERLFGVRVGEPGTHYAVRSLNEAIWSSGVELVGFSEVMLPLAEDEELKRLAEAGVLTAEKLASYASVCVAGLDMVPLEYSRPLLKRLLLDLEAMAKAKGKPIGVRIFPASGEYFEVPGFGRSPVLKLKG